MKFRLEYPNDGGAVDVEAEDIDTLVDLANKALRILWGDKARQLTVTKYGDAKMTLDETDKFMGQRPRGNR